MVEDELGKINMRSTNTVKENSDWSRIKLPTCLLWPTTKMGK